MRFKDIFTPDQHRPVSHQDAQHDRADTAVFFLTMLRRDLQYSSLFMVGWQDCAVADLTDYRALFSNVIGYQIGFCAAKAFISDD